MPNSLSLQSALVVAVVAAFALQWWLTRRAAAGFWTVAWLSRFVASLVSLRLIGAPPANRLTAVLLLAGTGVALASYRTTMLLAVLRTGRSRLDAVSRWLPGLTMALVLFALPALFQLGKAPSLQVTGVAFILFRVAPLLMLWELLQIIRRAEGWPDATSRRVYLVTLGYGLIVIPIGVVQGMMAYTTTTPLAVPAWLITLQMLWTAGDAAAGLYSVFALDHAERQWRAEMGERGSHLRSLGQLTSGAAHDLNNVLAAVVLVRDGWRTATPEERVEDVRVARESTERGLAIIDSLTQLRTTANPEETIELTTVFASLESTLRPLLGVGHALRVQGPTERVPLKGDRVALERVLQNLVSNARDAMREPGEIVIEVQIVAATLGREVVIRVRDTGCGIPAEVLHRVLEPFYTTKAAGRGNGLGLAMAHAFAVEAGGHLDLRSAVDVGTTVELFLPIAHVTASPLPVAPA